MNSVKFYLFTMKKFTISWAAFDTSREGVSFGWDWWKGDMFNV